MKEPSGAFARQSVDFVLGVFFTLVKMTLVLVVLVTGTLIAAQSAVAPVSTRLLTSYAVRFAVAACKPQRHFFPRPYTPDLKQN